MDFNKFILIYLPHTLRRTKLFSFIKVLISPVTRLYGLFLAFKTEQTIAQAGTGQICMLKKIVYDKLGLNINIVEDTGNPNDFIVQVTTLDTDQMRQLSALISKYKQAGKSFTINNTDIAYSQSWGDYICEIQNWIQTWADYVCEKLPLIVMYYKADYTTGSTTNIIGIMTFLCNLDQITFADGASLPVQTILRATYIDTSTNIERQVTFDIDLTSIGTYFNYTFTKSATEKLEKVELTTSNDGINQYILAKQTR
jgi:hypothetical protein